MGESETGFIRGRVRADHRDQPPGSGGVFPLQDAVIVVGRSRDADLRLDDSTVSRRHAELRWADGSDDTQDAAGWRIIDLGSQNGVWVGDERVAEAELRADQPVRLGAFTLHLLVDQASAGEDDGTEELERTLVWQEDSSGFGGLAAGGGAQGRGVAALDELSVPALEAEHIRYLLDFGRSLLGMDLAADRRGALCRVMVSGEMGCRCATMIRVWVDRPEKPPRVVSPSVARVGEALEEPHVSRSVLRALVARRQPVMATNEGAGQGGGSAGSGGDDSSWAELSINAEQAAITVMAAPVGEGGGDEGAGDGAWLDVLYVVAQRERGSSVWLTLLELAARLYREGESAWGLRAAAAERAAADREQTQARKIQLGLVPDRPTVKGFEVGVWFDPCLAVGGDYVDVMNLKDGQVLAVLADVSGKGLQAALVTAAVHAVVHAGVAQAEGVEGAGLSLATLLERVNDHLCEYTPTGSFATLVAALLDPATGEGEVCNAGHPPAMVVGADGSVSAMGTGDNMILGCIETTLSCEAVRLEPGQTLVFYSDGLTEAVDESGAMLGIEALQSAIGQACAAAGGVEGRVAELRRALVAYQGSAARADDETALFLCRTAESSG
ncbi:MAG: SpoIIE family protein phosphatase [Planctomycetota bacterium]